MLKQNGPSSCLLALVHHRQPPHKYLIFINLLNKRDFMCTPGHLWPWRNLLGPKTWTWLMMCQNLAGFQLLWLLLRPRPLAPPPAPHQEVSSSQVTRRGKKSPHTPKPTTSPPTPGWNSWKVQSGETTRHHQRPLTQKQRETWQKWVKKGHKTHSRRLPPRNQQKAVLIPPGRKCFTSLAQHKLEADSFTL